MYARVVPLLRLPRNMGVFDYRVPQGMSLTAGMLVRIPFRATQVFGVVVEVQRHTLVASARVKEVTSLTSPFPLLSGSLLRTAKKVAEDAYASLGTLYRSIVPVFPKTKTLTLTPLSEGPMEPSDAPVVPGSSTAHAESGALVTYTSDAALTQWYQTAITASIQSGRSVLIICPTIARLDELQRTFTTAISLHHVMRPTEYRSHFLSIHTTHTPVVVIGTRSAIFAPINRLGLILIDNEDHDEHVQDMPNPRYDARRAAVIRAQATGAAVVLTSRFASIVARERYPIAASIGDPSAISAEPIDLDEHHRSGSFSLLTDRALHAITDAVADDRSVVVVHHHHDLHGSIECPDCGYIPQCSTCMVALHHIGTELVCRHCATIQPIPATCPRCENAGLRGRGRGIAFVLRELANAGVHAREWSGHGPVEPRVAYVTTVAKVSSLPERSFGCIVMTRYDSLLSIPRYDADERARRTVIMLISRAIPNGRVLAQATERHQHAIRFPDDTDWRAKTIRERARFGYPPSWRITLLRRRDDSSHSRSANDVYRSVQPSNKEFLVTPPQRSPGRSKRDIGGTVIVIRHTHQLPEAVRATLAELDDGWSITVNPLDLR